MPKPEKIELDEVMLAMDVVDTLRHEQLLVERELASDERDQALIEKVKRMYAAQGLEVSDEVIAAGRGGPQGKPVRLSTAAQGIGMAGQSLCQAEPPGQMGGNTGCRPGWTVLFLPDRLCGAGSAATSTSS